MDLNVPLSFSSKQLNQTKDDEDQSQSPGFSCGSSLNRVVHQQLKKTDKVKRRGNVEMLLEDLYEVDEIPRHHRKLPRSTSSLSKSRYGSVASAIEDSTDLSTSGRKSKESCFRTFLRKKLMKTLKQTEDLAADQDQLKQTEELDQFTGQRIIPLPDQQPLSTDSSEKETSSCNATSRRTHSMFQNVSPSCDPTQSDSIPNRSASTDLLLPSASSLRRRDRSNSSPSVLRSLIQQDPPPDVSRPGPNPLLYGKTPRLCSRTIQERPDHLYGLGSADHIAKMSSEQLSKGISPPQAPPSVLESGIEEITETNTGTPRQPDTESVWSVSSTNREGGSSSYSSFSSFETQNFVSSPRFLLLPNSSFFPSNCYLHEISISSLNSSLTGISSAETMNQGTEVPEAGAERTVPILRDSLPALSYTLDFSSPTITSASTADTSASPKLDFSFLYQDDIPAFDPQSEDVSRERPPELFYMPDQATLFHLDQDEIMESVGHVSGSVPNRSASTDLLLPSASGLRRRDHSNSSPSVLCPLVHQDPPLDVSILPRAASLPSMKLQSSFEEFTPGFHGDADDETYWFQCSGPGLYQCRVSGLVFAMTGGGDVFYRVVPWNRRLLSPHGKKPAGPLFDISCLQQSVAQLHLPHCEVRSTGPCHFLSVAHLHDGGVEFIRPDRITETHIIISISGFSAFGNVKDEDSPAGPVQALVLLFYRPAADPESEHEINVLMLPKNVVLNNVLRFRRILDDKEIFLERPPDCKLQPNQVYSLSVCPDSDSVLVEPEEAEFDAESYDNYFSKFCVSFEKMMKHRLFLTDSSSNIFWKTHISAARVRRSCGPTRQNLGPKEQLMEIRINFKDGVSGPVLQSLLDNLLKEKVINDSEMEAVEAERTRGEKARLLVDTVRRKGDDASSKMIHFLCELDQHFSEYLGLM